MIDWAWMAQHSDDFLMGPQILVPERRYVKMLKALDELRGTLEIYAESKESGSMARHTLNKIQNGDFG